MKLRETVTLSLVIAAVLSGCGAPSAVSSIPESAPVIETNEGFVRACLFLKNQTGYQRLTNAFLEDQRDQTVSSWTSGLSDDQANEVESFFRPYDASWARGVVIDMFLDGSPPTSPEWIAIQLKCREYDVDVVLPRTL
jgi:type IV pilus biogenesis protein CpaD/CtpE